MNKAIFSSKKRRKQHLSTLLRTENVKILVFLEAVSDLELLELRDTLDLNSRGMPGVSSHKGRPEIENFSVIANVMVALKSVVLSRAQRETTARSS